MYDKDLTSGRGDTESEVAPRADRGSEAIRGPVAPSAGSEPAVTPAAPEAVAARAKLRLQPKLPVAEALATAFAAVCRYAQDQGPRSQQEPESAVHEFRKSVRRLRALTKLVTPLIGRQESRALQRQLREAARATSSLRDSRVLLATTQGLSVRKKATKAQGAVVSQLRAEIFNLSASGVEHETVRRQAQNVSVVAAQFRSCLPGHVEHSQLVLAIGDSYRKARKAQRQAAASGQDEDVHDWRKRTKELRYQLELLEPLPAAADDTSRELRDFAKNLGSITDLMVFEDYLRRQGRRIDGVAVKPLRKQVKKQIRHLLTALQPDAESFYKPKPKRFRSTFS